MPIYTNRVIKVEPEKRWVPINNIIPPLFKLAQNTKTKEAKKATRKMAFKMWGLYVPFKGRKLIFSIRIKRVPETKPAKPMKTKFNSGAFTIFLV